MHVHWNTNNLIVSTSETKYVTNPQKTYTSGDNEL